MLNGSINHDLHHLTPAERLWCWRKAEGFSQRRAAKLHGVTRAFYQDLERGDKPLPQHMTHSLGQRPLSPTDRLRLARRRLGLGSRGTAAEVGFSHTHLLALEIAADLRLVAVYRQQGFTL